jgi:vancomycin resistance protein VanJ
MPGKPTGAACAAAPATRVAAAPAVLFAISTAIAVGVAACRAAQPDACVAVTIWPPWLWLLPGLMLAAPLVALHRRLAGIAALIWLLFLLLSAEEARSLARAGLRPSAFDRVRRQGESIRVVSLNCGGGSSEAAGEVAPYRPDVVLLQESPGRADVQRLAARLYGRGASVLVGPDASLLIDGQLSPAPGPPRSTSFVRARAHLRRGLELELVSLRLTPPVVRMDLWAPDCWRDYAENRRTRRECLRAIVDEIRAVPAEMPMIVGGDFNARAGDAIYRLLGPRLRDSFPEAALGWANTALNDIPVSRIDQVWISGGLRPLALVARKTRGSDHRMVVCDLSRQ